MLQGPSAIPGGLQAGPEAGLRLKCIRESCGLSLSQWSALFKVPAPLLQSLERGETALPGLLSFLSAFLPLFAEL